jgi:hypothetical protein
VFLAIIAPPFQNPRSATGWNPRRLEMLHRF